MSLRRREPRDERGFTLIELMIVMMVIGILGGIVLFGIGAFQGQATTSRDEANAQQCRRVIEIYEARHNGDVPHTWDDLDGEHVLTAAPPGGCADQLGQSAQATAVQGRPSP
jgi:general secretion pathway protein G